MPDLELYPPDVDITPDLNLKIRIRVLAQVILDLAQGCGATDCEKSIKRGIIDKSIIDAQSPVFPRLKRSRCRSSQEVNDSPTPFSALNYC